MMCFQNCFTAKINTAKINSNWVVHVAVVALLGLAVNAEALVVKTWNGEGTPQIVNDTAPADDPGWHNASSNRSTIYLGNQWVITAGHAGVGNVLLPSGTYSVIPGTAVTLTNPGSFAGNSLSANADLTMYRINVHPTSGLTPEVEDPLIKDIVIASSSPGVEDEVLLIGAGGTRTLNQTAAGVQGQTEFATNQYGFGTTGPVSGLKTWGTNRVESLSSLGGVVKSGNNLLIELSGGIDTIGFLTQFDRGLNVFNNPITGDGSLPDEAQVANGDSGGPVFSKNVNDEWVLTGLLHALFHETAHNGSQAWFSDYTAISDYSYYKGQIDTLRASNQYSLIGDVDLDGSITGEIINGEATGDLAALIDGWAYQQAEGDVISWRKGDLNQDGITNLADFSLLRDALGGTISTSEIAMLLGGAVSVPEPTALVLLLFAIACPAFSRRR